MYTSKLHRYVCIYAAQLGPKKILEKHVYSFLDSEEYILINSVNGF
jgi:hypothetical protein